MRPLNPEPAGCKLWTVSKTTGQEELQLWRSCAGEPVYPGERERILGQKARRTRRLAARAARRSKVILRLAPTLQRTIIVLRMTRSPGLLREFAQLEGA